MFTHFFPLKDLCQWLVLNWRPLVVGCGIIGTKCSGSYCYTNKVTSHNTVIDFPITAHPVTLHIRRAMVRNVKEVISVRTLT